MQENGGNADRPRQSGLAGNGKTDLQSGHNEGSDAGSGEVRHLKRFGRVWHYFRRVPKRFADLDTRHPGGWINTSLDTRDEALAERKAVRLAEADERHWHKLVLAAAENEEADRRAAEEAADKEYATAVRVARAYGYAYETAAGLADERTDFAQLMRRIEQAYAAGKLDGQAIAALLGGVERPIVTFRKCAEAYVAENAPKWSNVKHRAQWASTLAAYAYPTIGEMDVGAVDVHQVLACLRPIWRDKPETASRVRQRIEAVLDYAEVLGYRDGPNPADRKRLGRVLPAKEKIAALRHHPAIARAELPAFMTALSARGGVAARCLAFVVLTAVRSGEARGARWGEVDLAAKVWTVPAERMKAGKEHRVPLSAPAVAILEGLRPEAVDPDAWVFPGQRSGKPLSDMALLAVLRDMARADACPGLRSGVTVHGFRSTFSDWTAEETAHPDFVREKALAHVVADKVEAAYRRGELFDKRAALMDDWADFCCGGTTGVRTTPPRGAQSASRILDAD